MGKLKKTFAIAVITTIAMTGFLCIGSVNAKAFTINGDGNSANATDIEKTLKTGDILFTYSPGLISQIIPGHWNHVGMYVGNGWVIESDENGVHYSSLAEWCGSNGPDELALGRVKTATNSQRQSAVNFAIAQLGKGYDYWWPSKQVYGSSYYCSELVWASYKQAGIDIDKNPGWSWTYANGVAPQEIYEDEDVSIYEYF
jgi:uncharacterized protein YycO